MRGSARVALGLVVATIATAAAWYLTRSTFPESWDDLHSYMPRGLARENAPACDSPLYMLWYRVLSSVVRGDLVRTNWAVMLWAALLGMWVVARTLGARPIFAAAAVVLAAAAVVERWRALLPAALFAVLLLVFGNPMAGDRQGLAFRQHAALNITTEQHLVVDPWRQADLVTFPVFGPAETVAAAARANPRAFVHHVALNVRAFPTLGMLLEPDSSSAAI